MAAGTVRAVVRDRWFWVLVGVLVLAVPLLLHQGRANSFYLDEFDFILNRDLSSPSSLLTPWNGHWVTLPAVGWRLLLEVFGLRTYLPYQTLAVAGHVAVVLLAWVLARRLGARGWIATAAMLPLVALGSGRHNILFGFQITLTASLSFGLAHLLLATHDGAWSRRDVVGLACGLIAITSSGLGVATTVGVGVAVLVLRGWRSALAHTAPLALLFGLWWTTAPEPTSTQPISLQVGVDAVRYSVEMVKAALGGLGGSEVVAVGIALLTAAGAAGLLVGPMRERRRVALLAGLAATGCTFLVATSAARAGAGTLVGPDAPRYVHVLVALALPVAAAGVELLDRRSAWFAGAALLVVAAGLPSNLRSLDDDEFPNVIAALARSEHLASADADRPLHQILPIPVALLQDAATNPAEWADVPVAPSEALRADLLLTLAQRHGDEPGSCPITRTVRTDTEPRQPIRFAGVVQATALEGDTRSDPVRFEARFGAELLPSSELTVELVGLGRGSGVLVCP